MRRLSCDGCFRIAEIDRFGSNITDHQKAGRYRSSIEGHTYDSMITSCLHFRTGERKPDLEKLIPGWRPGPNTKPADYFVSLDYNEYLYDDWIKPDGQKVLKSCDLTVSLYYNGSNGKELVQEWETVKEARDYGDLRPDSLPGSESGLRYFTNSMFYNPSAILRKLRPLELTVLNHFEKQPWSCEIEPSEEEVCPGEEVDVTVTNIQDIEGAESREFNRIVVTAYEGDIIGGTGIDAFPKYYAFLVGGGSVTFRYKAPVEGGVSGDKITVFNSCDISRVDQYALERTMPKDEIENKTIVIKACYDAIARLVRKEVVTEKGERTITIGDGTNTDKRDYRREIEATAHLMLESTRTLPMPMYGEYYEYYKIKKVQLTSFRATLRDWEYRYHKDENGWSELTEIWEGRDSNVRVYRPSVMFLEMGETYAIFDSETKKAKAVLLGGPSIDYTLKKTFFQEGRGEARTGPHYFTHTDSRDESRGFGFDTVDEEKPVINVSNIPSPDFIVTSGDGVNSMAGSGRVTTDDVSHNNRDYTTCKTEKTFTCQFKRMKK